MNTKSHVRPLTANTCKGADSKQMRTIFILNAFKTRLLAGSLCAFLAATPFTHATYAASYVTHIDPIPAPKTRVPQYNASNPLRAAYTDKPFGTQVVRITGEPGRPIVIDGSLNSGRKWPKHTCHQYSSNDGAWNADGSLLLLSGCNNRYGILLDGNTFKVLRVGLAGPGIRLWSRTSPDKMYAFGHNTVVEVFPRTNQTKTILTLKGYSGLTLDGHGQNTSDDGRWVAVTAIRQSDKNKVMFGIDLEALEKGPDVVAPANLNQGENVFISASGKYLIAGLGYGGKDQNIYETTTGRLVNTYRGNITTKHPDTYQLDGRDYWIFAASGGRIGGRVLQRDILTNQEHTYMDLGVANHVSTRNVRDGRWAIVTYDSTKSPFPLEIVAVRVDGDHRNVVRRLAKHNSVRKTYSNEPHPNPSPDGKKIVFASNWGGGATSAYVILLSDWDTPADCEDPTGGGEQSSFACPEGSF
jgi:hypothetical protein